METQLLTQLTVEMDSSVVDRIRRYADDRGWSVEETVRYVLGNEFAAFGSYSHMSQMLPGLPLPPTIPPNDIIKEFKATMAWMYTLMGIKCPECTQKLTAQDIIKGSCSKCGYEV